MTVASEDEWKWAHQLRPNGRTYFSEVEINRLREGDPNDHWDDVRAYDANSCIFHWEKELLKMFEDNMELKQRATQRLVLVVHCTAEWRTDADHERPYIGHTLTTHLRIKEEGKADVDLINNEEADMEHPFRMRGANYGNLCPTRCMQMVVR